MAGDESPPPPPTLDPSSPFYLGPNDKPGDFITPTRLHHENYDDWASDIQTAMEARRKFGFLNGTYTKPIPPCTQSDWIALNAMLISWIMNTITPEVKTSISKYREVKRLWDTLKAQFAVVNGPRIQQLHSSIARCEQTKTMTVAAYYAKLNVLWEELHNHEPIIECACCTSCTAGSRHEERRENGKLHQFLMGLYSDYYAQTRANILSQDALPSLNRAYQLVIQEERVRKARQPTEDRAPEVLGFALRTDSSRGRGRGDRVDKSHLTCTHCKKTGHEVSHCFEIVGYPEWYEERMKTDGGRGRGRFAGRGRGQSVRANAASTNHDCVPNDATTSSIAGSSNSSSLFSADQWKVLTGMFGNVKIPDNRLTGPIEGGDWNGC
ncbi:uncharacterized protein [Spinacia oleracea]|uniref:Retrotransposon Copia-like N-terminal domain-containing protein n=1 Tax=Spinacia oleracea TaxID=3562 RepID=A0A9R0KAN5_SPIOL|nr:uncharacterized protein LOC110802432 [Spinacia oleracea]